MSSAHNSRPLEIDDPRYREGQTHLQAGEWPKAMRCFEALLLEYPDSVPVREALEDARFKASIDASKRIRAKRWIVPLRAIVFRLLVIALIVLMTAGVYRLVNRQFAPALAQAQTQREQKQLLVEGDAHLQAGELDAAEARYTELLAQLPNSEEAQQGLVQIKTARDLDTLYQSAVQLQESGQSEDALKALTELSVKSPAYRDVNLRIAAIKKQQALDSLFARAEADAEAGLDVEAVAGFEELRALNAGYQGELIADRLFDLYMRLGNGLIEGAQPQADDLSAAAAYYAKALALQPRNAQALLEKNLVDLYLSAQSNYRLGNWERAATEFETIYVQRPDYLNGQVVALLYDVYIRNGETYRAREDCAFAYEQYRKAGDLPVADRALVIARLDETRPCITPTPSPTITPTETPYRYIEPTTIPTGTPPPPLATLRNKIVFRADHEDSPGFWVMNPDGSNARYLGDSDALEKEYAALIEREQLSPDGRYRVYVGDSEQFDDPQLFIQGFEKDQFDKLPNWQVTHFTGLNYDPVWAPDGSRIAYVSTHQGSDDIWVINPDGTNAWNYTRNKWEWDKHPSWSPDSQKIVFWSNREGTKQIFVVDANGQNLKKIHATTWDEYDPIWIK